MRFSQYWYSGVSVRNYGKNVTAKVLSVLFAVLLWLHVTTNTSFSSKFTLPIQYVGPSEGYILASDKPEKATVVIKGMGKDLFAFYLLGLLRSDDRYALVNLTGLPEGPNTVVVNRNMIHLGLFSELTIENILYPDNATFGVDIDRLVKRTVAVDADSLTGYKVADGYCEVGKPKPKPAFIVIRGPQDVVETYNSLRIASIGKETLYPDNNSLKARLEEPRFITVEPVEIDLHFDIEQIVTKRLSGLRPRLNDFPGKNRPEFSPDSLTVSFRGPSSIISRLEADDVVLAIDYNRYRDFMARNDSLITPTVSLPRGYEMIDVVDVVPKAVLFHTGS